MCVKLKYRENMVMRFPARTMTGVWCGRFEMGLLAGAKTGREEPCLETESEPEM